MSSCPFVQIRFFVTFIFFFFFEFPFFIQTASLLMDVVFLVLFTLLFYTNISTKTAGIMNIHINKGVPIFPRKRILAYY